MSFEGQDSEPELHHSSRGNDKQSLEGAAWPPKPIYREAINIASQLRYLQNTTRSTHSLDSNALQVLMMMPCLIK